ncbi:class I SAM-dependent methyltransferase [Curtobacterium sp. Leaf261]|uniref:class I SAM-dependent methyltransferase n=1 Tax=Curtobacterium sp. Leaf261 TaxID=1736311 RepID=UPI0006F82397|nr:class I SAM-dependent methyltransferase [Curtobacterium sp. Leaf261]KQO65123.1 hypothetical protein ASF23_03090 [Curtobacterium sp. Leaf261]
MDDLLRAAYDAGAAAYAAALPDLRAETTSDQTWISAFADVVARSPVSVVADVGCGHGRMTPVLSARGVDVVGSDLSPAMIAIAKAAHPGVRFEVAPLDAQPWADGSVGGVLAWYSVIHTPPEALPRVFAEWRRVLAPAGHVLLAFQEGAGTRPLAWAARQGFGLEARLQSVTEVTDALVASGFTVVDSGVRPPAAAHERDPQGFVLARVAEPAC